MQILHTAIPYREVQGLQGNLCNEDTDKNFVDNFLHVVIYLALVANIKIVLQVNCYTKK